MKKSFQKIFLLSAIFLFSFFSLAEAQEIFREYEQGTVRARVVEVLQEEERIIPGTEAKTIYQSLTAEILEGEKEGEIVIVENDFLQLKPGEKFFMNYLITFTGDEIYSVYEPDRKNALFFFIGLLIVVILFFGRMQGLRSLLSLGGSFFVIIYFLLPKILSGAPPVLTSIIFSTIILVFTIYITHGLNKKSTSAVLGTIITIIFTGLLAYFAVDICRLSGFVSDEAVFLNFATAGQLNFSGLLLGAIIIGTLGILDDIAITQAACVEQLYATARHLSRKEIYKKALKVGKEHVGALVNTLALAYTGAALPLLLLFSGSESSALIIINREVFATEIIRTIVGSIGLILAVPVTTLLAVFMLIRRD